jgi:hypothetical protein
MKKLMTVLAAVAVAGIASADLTGWELSGGVVYDQNSTMAVNFETTGITLLGVGSEFEGNTIDISVLKGLTEVGGAQLVGVGQEFLGYAYACAFGDDASAIGTATFLVVNGVVSGLDDIEVGDYVGVATPTFDIEELWAAQPDGQPSLNQTFTLSDVTTSIEVIPEPATLGLMGIAGLGLFLARKKARR